MEKPSKKINKKRTIQKKKEYNWTAIAAVSNFITAFCTFLLAIATVVLAWNTYESISQSKASITLSKESIQQSEQQFRKLNRPFVTIDNKLQPEGSDIGVTIKNIGNTSAENVIIKAYFTKKDDLSEQTLINGLPETNIGLLYPEENKIIVILNPALFLGKMSNDQFNIKISYSYINICIEYYWSSNFTGTNWRLHEIAEKETECKK
ncbi:hypothetical protein C4569_01595 [Candidatus Parcubacteria bacterium]|nr:MAG: hypothetical protein C4569_01595 [Candidatus Parcubacteria bacterium]